jgi:hypothetical protein
MEMEFAGNDLLEDGSQARHEQSASQFSQAPNEPKSSISVQTEFSRGFGDWLISHQVGLVCSSYLTGYLLFIGVRANGMLVPSAASFSMAMGWWPILNGSILAPKMRYGGWKIS